MTPSFYFYDLETSGINPRGSRIMQFAGQRTDLQLKPFGEPDNILIKLTEDVLPDPDAVLVTGITPQKTVAEGVTEADFLRHFSERIALPGTIFTGFNNIRFDDEFMRFSLYRNFYDAYEWSWKNGSSRWDLLDVVRLTRALRPEGIAWPFGPDGKPSNRLELLTGVNKLDHKGAHDALSDVKATIAVARMIYNKQPKLFDYLLKMRSKKEVETLASNGQPFIYTSGKYPSLYNKTTVVTTLGAHPGKQGVLVYDLRHDPEDFVHMDPAKLAVVWHERPEDETKRFPVKTMQFNRCPAVAPLGVLDEPAKANIKIDLKVVQTHLKNLTKYPQFYKNLLAALKIMDKQQQASLVPDEQTVDSQLYDGFVGDKDKVTMSVIRAATPDEVGSLSLDFEDTRLNHLLPLYKARNFPGSLTADERASWEKFRYQKLMGGGMNSQASRYFKRLGELAETRTSGEDQFLLTELQLYGESILPTAEL